MGDVLDGLLATGAPQGKIERFLDADVDGTGVVRDRMAADMTNHLMSALGHKQRHTAETVRRIRERGNWVVLGQRPRQ
jgi:hypothetical protein